MRTFVRLTRNPEVMGGQVCVRGTRITAARVLEVLPQYPGQEALLQDYPSLLPEDIQEVLDYAVLLLRDEWVPLPAQVA